MRPIHSKHTDVRPEEVGFNPKTLERLDLWFQQAIEAQHIQAAAYLIARKGKVFAWKSMGPLSAIDDRGDFQPDSIHRIASVSKVITATGIMQLVEQGKIAIEQPVSTILAEFNNPVHGKIAIHHLLTHTSGLAADSGAHNEPYPQEFAPWEKMDNTNWIKLMLQGPLQYPVGEVWNYCTKGFWFLGEIIARISGMPYHEYLQQYIFGPLGMTRTFVRVPESYHSQLCIMDKWGIEDLTRPVEPGKDTTSLAAGGGIYSTIEDLWKFGQAYLNKGEFNGARILGRKTVEAMTRNHLYQTPNYNWGANVKNKPYGLGWEVDKDPLLPPGTFSHEGWGWTTLCIDPSEDMVFVAMLPSLKEWWDIKVMAPRAMAWSGIM